MEIFYKTISELESMLDSKEISAVELAKALIERKNSVDGKVGAFLSANEDELLAEASISDSLRADHSVKVLAHACALEKVPAVQTASKYEVPLHQGACFPENIEYFFVFGIHFIVS